MNKFRIVVANTTEEPDKLRCLVESDPDVDIDSVESTEDADTFIVYSRYPVGIAISINQIPGLVSWERIA